MRKRQKLLAISTAGAAMIVIGVWNGAGRNSTEWDEIQIEDHLKSQMTSRKEDESMDIELTKTEKDILEKISADESAIEQGLLLTWQKELIWDMREATAALEAAYPSHTFQIVDAADSRMDTSTKSVFWFVADGGEKRYVLYLSEKDRNKAMRDTFFGTLLSEPYEQALLSWIQKKVPVCVGCQVSFDCAVGEAYTEASVHTVMQALLKGEDALTNFTELYVDGTDCEDSEVLAGQLEREIRRQGIYGTYEIAVLLQRPEETAVYAETDWKETVAHAETDWKETIANAKTGGEAATAHMEETGGHTYIEPEMERKAETEQTTEADIEKGRIESKDKELKSTEEEMKNIIKHIEENRNNSRYVWIYTFSCFA